MTPEEMRESLESAPATVTWPEGLEFGTEESGRLYDLTARSAAKRILGFLDAHPEFKYVPAEGKYDWLNKDKFEGFHVVYAGMSELLDLAGIKFSDLGLSGFQYGWAVNAAKYAVDAPQVPNPAIVTINI